MHRALLVADENVLYLVLLEQLVIDEKDGTARITEDVLYLFFLQAPDYNLCASQLHRFFQIKGNSAESALPYWLGRRWSRRPPASTQAKFPFSTRISALATPAQLSDFLAGVERRAFKQAMFAVRDEDTALDIVQDAMLKLSEKYGDRPAEELPLLFQRIMQNAIRDHYRRQKVRSTWTTLLSAFSSDEDDEADPLETLPGGEGAPAESPHGALEQRQILAILEAEISRLPARQREAFLLRYWEELDIAETARAMGCSEGSVKTHCSRATHTLAAALKARGITL